MDVAPGSQFDIAGYEIPDLSTIDFTDKSSHVPLIIIINAVFMSLIVVLVSAKIYARTVLANRFQTDDALIIAATLVSLTCSSLVLYSIRLGMGTHVWTQDLSDMNALADKFGMLGKMLNNGACILYSFALNLAKCAIVVLYIRVFPVKWFRICMYIYGAVLVSSFIITVFIVVFNCSPMRAAWDWRVVGAKCMNYVLFLQIMGGFNIATDVVLAFAPIVMLWNLKMSKREKIAIGTLVVFGIFACVASTIRFVRLSGLRNFDFTYTAVSPVIWSIIEVNVAIICGSLSSIKPILVRHFPFWAIINRSLVTVNELPRHEHHDCDTTKNSTFTNTNRMFSSSSSDSYVPQSGYNYDPERASTPESPRTVKRDWTVGYDSVSSSNKDKLGIREVNWDDYWKTNMRDDISAPIDKDIRLKVEMEGLQMQRKKDSFSSTKRISFSNLIPLDTFRRPSATSSHRSRDEEKELKRQRSTEDQKGP